MISLILYGRNDSYGYNLHKRAAISLNCMAEMLTSPDDEIIFVDYNTPDDFPTFPEAIQDTLTERARKLLRILRVRPSQHEQFRHLTHLVALEPIARNVAVRRSNPANRWILSTNTDMVFVPQHGATLSEIATNLPDAYYPLPRYEVPESLWESANRLDPKGTIEAFGTWGREFHLNEIVLGSDSIVKYDAPGDFQLVLRSDLWQMHAFHEGMLLGWHVDSNLAKRLALLPREPGELLDDIQGYHCDHTRQVTPAHKSGAAENDLGVFFEDVSISQLPDQAESWGLAGEIIEEITVNTTSRRYLDALHSTISGPLTGPIPSLYYSYESHNRIDYSVDHVLPFLADAFASYSRDTRLGWFGCKRTLLENFAWAWTTMGFSNEIMVWPTAHWLGPDLPTGCAWASEDVVLASSDVFLFDWGRRDGVSVEAWHFDADEAVQGVLRGLRAAVRGERLRFTKGLKPRRFIGINAVANSAERIFHDLVGAARTPIATRIRQGYVNDLSLQQELIAGLQAGGAGRKASGGIVSRPGVPGCVFYGPYMLLDSGNYRLYIEFDAAVDGDSQLGFTGLGIEAISSSCLLGNRAITLEELRAGELSFDLVIPTVVDDPDGWPETEFRLRTVGQVGIAIRRVMLTKFAASGNDANRANFDFLSLSTVGQAGAPGPIPPPARHRTRGPSKIALSSKPGVADFVAYGPHVWLWPGRYEATYEFWVQKKTQQSSIVARVEIVSAFGEFVLAEDFVETAEHGFMPAGAWEHVQGVLSFDIRTEARPEVEGLLEIRVWSEGSEFTLVALSVHRVGDAGAIERGVKTLFGAKLDSTRDAIARRVQRVYLDRLPPQDVLWVMRVGPVGRRALNAIEAVRNADGIVAHGPYLWLIPGHYEVTFVCYAERIKSRSHVKFEVATNWGNTILAERVIEPHWFGRRFERVFGRRKGKLQYTLPFEITTDAPPAENGLLEFRVWAHRTSVFKLTAVLVRQVDGL